ncbi:MAG: hypothetical protein ACK56I_00595, partial [bacterium]
YPMYATIKDKVTIHTDPVNPDRDTPGTGHYEMYRDPLLEGAISLHDPQGCYMGTTWDRCIKKTGVTLDQHGIKQIAVLC